MQKIIYLTIVIISNYPDKSCWCYTLENPSNPDCQLTDYNYQTNHNAVLFQAMPYTAGTHPRHSKHHHQNYSILNYITLHPPTSAQHTSNTPLRIRSRRQLPIRLKLRPSSRRPIRTLRTHRIRKPRRLHPLRHSNNRRQ